MLLQRVKRTIDRYHLLSQGDRLVVGVSGGADSMVLIHLLNAYRPAFDLSLVVAHINHGLRPTESEKEAELVQKESDRLGLTFEYGQFSVREFQRNEKLSLQEAARELRFRFFEVLLQKHGANKIALGHNADDQVETVLLRFMRGSGSRGLKGMLPIREGKVIRPLLEVWRKEIECFAEEKRIPYLLDSSNLKEDYFRNRLRLALIPLIEKEYQPNFKKIVLKTSAIFREENAHLESETEKAYEKIVREDRAVLSFKFPDYQSLHPAIQWRVIRVMLDKMGHGELVSAERKGSEVGRICRKLYQPSPSFLMRLSHGISLEKRYDLVSLRRGWTKPVPPFEVELLSPGRNYIEEIEREIVIEEAGKEDKTEALYGLPEVALLDYQTLRFPLRVRNLRPGDRFQPLGVKGTQKLKEFFIDHKVPKYERPGIPLLMSGEMIAWVVGYRIDERVKVTEKTQKVLKVRVM
ncbi:MAG: tRNA lysidine(34) synthetase TilS [Thermodesulfobacteriota bacterium]